MFSFFLGSILNFPRSLKRAPLQRCLVGGVLAGIFLGSAASSVARAGSLPLQQVAQTRHMVWNAVARFRGATLVGGPRWAWPASDNRQFLSVASTGADTQTPWPDADWNSWRPGDDPRHKFVNVNALHIAPDGDLWIVDTGTPVFGSGPLPNAAKVVRIDATNGQIRRIYPLGPELALPGSYIDDVRFHSPYAFLTDAGRPGLLVLNMDTGQARRVLNAVPATTAQPDRPIVVPFAPPGSADTTIPATTTIVRAPDGKPLRINTDPIEVSPDGSWLYFGTLEGPWSKVPTAALENPDLSPAQLEAQVSPWANLPPVGGTAIDAEGNLYFSNLREDAEQVRAPDGTISTLTRSPELHWVDAPFLDSQGLLWLPVSQLDRAAPFNKGQTRIHFPVQLFRISVAGVPASLHEQDR
ncbi:hypothetical protein E3202_01030 [Oecophyllibacter saccharovorans]|uniref:Gluconolactonase n=1 Tax=Oecophyllibacter saccharovorans TaxID=2558360 RepID=A0A506UQI1_9PROT|nr:hypothetical protein E3202_01030 [Oecophyllibacter saccharovorans]